MAHPSIRFPRLLNVCFRIALLAALAALLLTPAAAQAGNTCIVTSLDDSGTGTLRDHIADTDCDTIDVAPDLLPGTIELDSQLTIDRHLAIQGPGANDLTISGGGTVRVFEIATQSVDVAISGVTITGGSTPPGAFFPGDAGGGIRNAGNLTVTAVAISGNSAGNGAGIYSFGMLTLAGSEISGNTARWGGGGIFSDDVIMTVTNTTISDNQATEPRIPTVGGRGGGIFTRASTATVTGSDISGNSAAGSAGGGIWNGGNLVVEDSDILENSVFRDGGGIFSAINTTLTVSRTTISGNRAVATRDFPDVGGLGGGIFSRAATATVTGSTIFANSAAGSAGGGIWNDGGLTVENSAILENSASGRGAGIHNLGDLVVISSTISGNERGGISNFAADGTVTVTGSTISGNSAPQGGGIENHSGELTVTNSTISGNSASAEGGGIWNTSLGTATVTGSTISGNSGGFGGGIANGGTLAMTNSTISGNEARVRGGGILNVLHGTLTVTNSTILGNSAAGSGGGIQASILGTVTVKNTIVAGNRRAENCAGPIDVEGVNLADDASCTGFTQAPAVMLGPLRNNGGPTQTHALLPRSPAIEAATDCTDTEGNDILTDQRGIDRPQGAACDVGAFEREPRPGMSP